MFDRRGAGERKKEMRSKCFRGMMKGVGQWTRATEGRISWDGVNNDLGTGVFRGQPARPQSIPQAAMHLVPVCSQYLVMKLGSTVWRENSSSQLPVLEARKHIEPKATRQHQHQSGTEGQ